MGILLWGVAGVGGGRIGTGRAVRGLDLVGWLGGGFWPGGTGRWSGRYLVRSFPKICFSGFAQQVGTWRIWKTGEEDRYCSR